MLDVHKIETLLYCGELKTKKRINSFLHVLVTPIPRYYTVF